MIQPLTDAKTNSSFRAALGWELGRKWKGSIESQIDRSDFPNGYHEVVSELNLRELRSFVYLHFLKPADKANYRQKGM